MDYGEVRWASARGRAVPRLRHERVERRGCRGASEAHAATCCPAAAERAWLAPLKCPLPAALWSEPRTGSTSSAPPAELFEQYPIPRTRRAGCTGERHVANVTYMLAAIPALIQPSAANQPDSRHHANPTILRIGVQNTPSCASFNPTNRGSDNPPAAKSSAWGRVIAAPARQAGVCWAAAAGKPLSAHSGARRGSSAV